MGPLVGRIVVTAVLLLAAAGGAAAQGEAARMAPAWISEIRAGVMYHEDSRFRRVFFNQDKNREDGMFDINGEILFAAPQWDFDNPVLEFLLKPRPRIGASVNLGRGTSQASAGLAWTYYIWKGFFWEGSLDIAVHDGWTDPTPPPRNLRGLGCSPILRQSMSLGIDINENWRIIGTFEHLDNFGLCNNNQGLSNHGLRLGYRF